MADERGIDFWFAVGSTYTFLSVMRLPDVERRTGIKFRWRPFYLGKILRDLSHVPFADKPAKLRYMWRDIERKSNARGLQVRLPAPYPAKNAQLASRTAFVCLHQGQGVELVQEIYRRWYRDGVAPGDEPWLSEILAETGHDPARILALATSAEIDAAMDRETDEARRIGIFGAPSFVVGNELFWGDDRLEDAIAWHRQSQ